MIRRDFLKILSLFGVTGTISYLLNTNQIQAGIQEIKGEVEINGNEFKSDSKNVQITSNSIIKTSSNSSLIFVIGKDAFLLHNNTHIELQPDNKEIEISGFNLKAGSILSVLQLKIFFDKLEVGLKKEKTFYHKALSRSERKELTLLSMILIPRNWTIENRGMTVIVRPPEEAEKVRVELERRQKSDTSRRLARR